MKTESTPWKMTYEGRIAKNGRVIVTVNGDPLPRRFCTRWAKTAYDWGTSPKSMAGTMKLAWAILQHHMQNFPPALKKEEFDRHFDSFEDRVVRKLARHWVLTSTDVTMLLASLQGLCRPRPYKHAFARIDGRA